MEWISIKDKLPNTGIDVMVYDRDKKQISITYRLNEEYPDDPELCNRIVWSEQGIFNSITHWMPLPNSPKDQ